jgi:hypothetical protein
LIPHATSFTASLLIVCAKTAGYPQIPRSKLDREDCRNYSVKSSCCVTGRQTGAIWGNYIEQISPVPGAVDHVDSIPFSE